MTKPATFLSSSINNIRIAPFPAAVVSPVRDPTDDLCCEACCKIQWFVRAGVILLAFITKDA
jgi:hypothetical protein